MICHYPQVEIIFFFDCLTQRPPKILRIDPIEEESEDPGISVKIHNLRRTLDKIAIVERGIEKRRITADEVLVHDESLGGIALLNIDRYGLLPSTARVLASLERKCFVELDYMKLNGFFAAVVSALDGGEEAFVLLELGDWTSL